MSSTRTVPGAKHTFRWTMDEGEHPTHVRSCPCRAIGSCRLRAQAASQTAPPYLPGEITDRIISFLPEIDHRGYPHGYSSLCSCALVCRNWLPASRHTLLTDVTITSYERYSLFVSRVVRSQLAWRLSTLRLSLQGNSSDRRPDNLAHMETVTRLFIHELGSQFPNLEMLYLNELNFDTMKSSPPHRKFSSLSAFASVRDLTLLNCIYPSFAAVRYTLTSLPSLTYLLLGYITWSNVSQSSEEPLLPFLRSSQKSPFLRRIHYLGFLTGDAGTCDSQMLQWLSTTSLAFSLKDLRVSSVILLKGSGLWEYVGPSTTQLYIGAMQANRLSEEST